MSWLNRHGDVDSDANENEKSNEIEIDSRTYSPYLIEYHEDTNSFTYNDPWNEVDQENDSLINDQETCSHVELPPPEVIVEHTTEPSEVSFPHNNYSNENFKHFQRFSLDSANGNLFFNVSFTFLCW